jgi:hypothetical protein
MLCTLIQGGAELGAEQRRDTDHGSVEASDFVFNRAC